jgi:hypothetical protein
MRIEEAEEDVGEGAIPTARPQKAKGSPVGLPRPLVPLRETDTHKEAATGSLYNRSGQKKQ